MVTMVITVPCARAVVSDPWDNQMLLSGTHDVTIYRGETYVFTPRFQLLSRPYAIPTNATVMLYWSTNNFASVWSTNGVLLADTGRVSVTWSPACDGGAGAYSYFIGIQEANGLLYRARGQITMRTSPGFNPSPASLPAWDGWFTNNYQYVSWLQMLAFSNSASSALGIETNRAQIAEAGLASNIAIVGLLATNAQTAAQVQAAIAPVGLLASNALTAAIASTGTYYAASILSGSATNWTAMVGTNLTLFVVTAQTNSQSVVVAHPSTIASSLSGATLSDGTTATLNTPGGVTTLVFAATSPGGHFILTMENATTWGLRWDVGGAHSTITGYPNLPVTFGPGADITGVATFDWQKLGPYTNTYILASHDWVSSIIATSSVNYATVAGSATTAGTVTGGQASTIASALQPNGVSGTDGAGTVVAGGQVTTVGSNPLLSTTGGTMTGSLVVTNNVGNPVFITGSVNGDQELSLQNANTGANANVGWTLYQPGISLTGTTGGWFNAFQNSQNFTNKANTGTSNDYGFVAYPANGLGNARWLFATSGTQMFFHVGATATANGVNYDDGTAAQLSILQTGIVTPTNLTVSGNQTIAGTSVNTGLTTLTGGATLGANLNAGGYAITNTAPDVAWVYLPSNSLIYTYSCSQ